MDNESALVLQVSVCPDVVVAGEEMHLHTHVGQFGQLAEEARVALRHHVAPLAPEVEHVAEEVDGARLCLYAVKETNQPSLLRAAVVDGPRAKVGIAKEIYVFHPQSVFFVV